MPKLTRREKQVLELLCHGLDTKLIATVLGTSPATVKAQKESMVNRLHAETVAHACYLAGKDKLVDDESV